MTCNSQIHVNDIGTAFRISISDETCNIVNISGATTKEILFTKPDNTTVTKTATSLFSGLSGIIQYVTASGDLDIPGIWKIQGHVAFSTYDLYTNISSFRVYDNLD